ncbi:MAG TPA: S8 family serine peptidase [Caldimonas sp.]|nr:S8 family serine peptidase [Caldimonas sp.]
MTDRSAWRRALGWLASLACGAALTAPATAADAPPAPDAVEALQHQVLVLVRLPPAHFRPGGSYGVGYPDAPGRAARARIVASLAREHDLRMVTDWPMPLLGLDCYVLSVPDDRRADAVAADLANDARVEWAQPMNTYRSLAGGDPLAIAQPAAQEWHLATLHGAATGRGTKVAIIDSGIDAQHPDLAGQVLSNENFVAGSTLAPETHGTAVAGIVAALADNGIGIAGIAPGARLLALRGCWQQSTGATLCSTLALARALHAAVVDQVDVINLSVSGPSDRLLDSLLDVALERGIAVVAAADARAPDGGFPAAHPGVFAVVENGAERAPAHAWRAPGRDVPTTAPGGGWAFVSGASYAAAHVSGLLALVRERRAHAPAALGAQPLLVRAADGRIDACATLGLESCATDGALAAPASATARN